MNRLTYLLVFLIFQFLLFVHQMHGQEINIRMLQQEKITAYPGEMTTIMLEIENLSNSELSYLPTIPTSSAIKAVYDTNSIKLSPKEKHKTLISLSVAPRTNSGAYNAQYILINESTPKDTILYEIPIFIKEKVNVKIEGISSTEYVVAGNTIEASFLIKNKGNSSKTVSLQPFNCELVGPANIQLKPNEIYIANVLSDTPPTVQKLSKKSFRLEATITGDSTAHAHAYLNSKILPNGQTTVDNIHRLPGYARLSYIGRSRTGQDYMGGWQGELFTAGALDRAGNHHLEVRLRGPNQFQVSALGQFDEYYARYNSPNLTLHVGDQNFSISTLTEFARYGRGVSASIRHKDTEYGAFAHLPRFIPSLNQQYGGFVRHSISNNHIISGNIVHNVLNTEGSSSTIWSARSIWSPLENLTLETELAQGVATINSKTNVGYAGFIRIESNPLKRLNVSGLLLYADEDYRGYYNNTVNYSANINYRISEKISVFANIFNDERNFAQDTLFETAPASRQWQTGIDYRISRKTKLKMYLRQQELEDLLPGKKFHRRNRFLKLQLHQIFGSVSLMASGEYGLLENYLVTDGDRTSRFFRSYVDATYHINNRHRIRGFVQFFDNQIPQIATQQQFIFGVAAESQLTSSTYLRFQYQNNFDIEEYYRDRNQMEFQLTQFFKKVHSFSVISRYALQRQTIDRGDFSVVAQYQYNFGIALEQEKEYPDVIGKIENNGTSSLEGIVLNMDGRQTVTDAQGNFVFKSIAPGKYHLFVNKSTMGVQQVPDIPMPLLVEVLESENVTVSFGLTNSVTISGEVDFLPSSMFMNNKDNELVLPSPLLIELTNGTETLRQMTESDGSFTFSGIRPGSWQVHIIHGDGFKHFEFETLHFEMELKSGERKAIKIKMKKRERKIRFLQSLSLSSND